MSNEKYDWCGQQDHVSDKEFLGWIYARLHRVFGERAELSYMKRFENIIDEMEQSKMINSEMTKEEAIKLMASIVWNSELVDYKNSAAKWVDVWEKLGIVKFKNEDDSVLVKLAKDPELSKRREAFRQSLADAGMPEHTLYSSPVLKAFDKAHGLRK